MKNAILWALAIIVTLSAAIYQRYTGPTYPKRMEISANGTVYGLKLVRSLSLDEKSEVKLHITDQSIEAKLYYKIYKSADDYQSVDFIYHSEPVDSWLMNKVFKITEDKGLFAEVPQQPEAGKLQYYFEITDASGVKTILKESPVVIRFKGGVPSLILIPHIFCMFFAMLFSTLAGMMALIKHPLYKKYSIWTLVLFIAGGMILGPIVQNYAFGDLWTGIPFGWDLTDNKTLIALIFWIIAVYMNRKEEKPLYVALAAFILLLVYSIPHSLFGSELDYASGQVTQGMILYFF